MARTHRNLYSQVWAWENLVEAFRKSRRGKRTRPDVCQFEYNLEAELVCLQDELRERTYRPGVYRHFRIFEPKMRMISAAPFRDRVVHHALCNVIEPLLERSFIFDSYACRKHKGLHAALERCTEFAHRFEYVLKTDVVKFFPSIDHHTLLNILRRSIADEGVIDLIALILQSGCGVPSAGVGPVYFDGDDLFAALRPRGLPIGNLTSQFFANVYLNLVDHFVKDDCRVKGYVRYADDMLCFSNSKSELQKLRSAIESFLHKLRLCIHDRKTVIMPVRHGIPFLGMVVRPGYRRLKHANVQRIHRRMRRLEQEYSSGEISSKQVLASFMGWKGYAQHAACSGLIEELGQKAAAIID